MKKELIENVYTPKQIQAIKDCINYGPWGDDNQIFPGIDKEQYAFGYCTNDIKKAGHFKGKQISGIMSGISKRSNKIKNGAILCIPDYWGDGKSGDMLFFNMEALQCNSEELEKWAKDDGNEDENTKLTTDGLTAILQSIKNGEIKANVAIDFFKEILSTQGIETFNKGFKNALNTI